jgi:acyl-CoA thioester hydrolase
VSSPDRHHARTVPVAVRYDDLGPAGHVINAATVRIIEVARRTFLGRPSTPGASGGLFDHLPDHVHHVVRRQDVEYAAELGYQVTPFLVTMWVTGVGTTSVRLHSEIRDQADRPPGASAETVIVLCDGGTGLPWPIPAEIAGRFVAGVAGVAAAD